MFLCLYSGVSFSVSHGLGNRYTMACPPVRGDNTLHVDLAPNTYISIDLAQYEIFRSKDGIICVL